MAEFYETSESAKKDYLKSNWYKASYTKVKEALLEVAKEKGYKVVHINDEYSEIFVIGDNFEATFKLYQMKPTETSLDMYFIPKMIFDFGRSKKIITEIYSAMKKKVQFIGLGIHA